MESGAKSKTMNVTCAANLLLKSVSRFKASRVARQHKAGAPPRPRYVT